MTALLLIGAILSETVGTLALKASAGLSRRAFLVPLIVGYLAAFALLAAVLGRGMAIGVAYGIWAAAGIALAAVASRFLFGEPLTRTMGVGIALIAVGVLTVEIGAAH